MVELTIVSGFLGAGKTTLLRQLILHSLSRGERCVVIENEFGSVGLDAALLARTGVPVHELNHGCVCCTLKSSFVETLRHILGDSVPDRVFFEPSGIFIPDAFLETLREPGFLRRCHVAPFITVVDAKAFSLCRKKFGTFFRRQAEFADVLAISKAGEQSAAFMDELQAELREINPRADQLLVSREGIAVHDLEAMLDDSVGFAEASSREALPISEPMVAKGKHARFRMVPPDGHGFERMSGRLSASMSIAELNEILTDLTSGRYGNVVRAKGQLRIDVGWVDFSVVGGSIDITELRPAGHGDRLEASSPLGQIVVIGEGLDKAGLRERLNDPTEQPDPCQVAGDV